MEERLTVRVGANLSEFERKMSQMQGKINGVGKNMSSIGSSMTKYITAPAAGAIAAAGGIVAAFGWKRLVGLDSAQAQLKGLGYEVKDVERISDQVTSAVQGTTMTMAEGTSVAAGALAAGVEEGAELESYIKAVGNAAVGSGREVGEMASIFNRVQGSGKLMTQELNMIEDGMPGFAQAMADSMGVGMEEFRKMVTAGEVSSEDFLTVMDDFAGDMSEAYANSWEGMVANTKAWIGILGENLLGGVFEHSKDSIGEFMEMLKSDAAQEWATEMGEKIGNGFGRVIDTVKGVINWWSELGGTTKKVIGVLAGLVVAAGPVLMVVGKAITFVSGVVSALSPLLTSIAKAGGLIKWLTPLFSALTGPVGITVAVVAALGAAFVVAYNKSETFRNFIDGLKDRFMGAWESAMEFKDKVIDAISGITAFFKGDTESGIDLLRSIGLSDETIETIWETTAKIRRRFEELKLKIREALAGVKNFFVEQFDGVRAWWDSDGSMILSAISTAFEWTMDAISDAVKFGLDLVVSLFQTFAPIVEGIWNVLWPTIVYLAQTAWEKIKLVVGIAMDLVKGIISGVAAIIEGDWSKFGEVLKDTALSIWDRVVEFFGNMKDNALELMNNLTGGGIDKFIELKDGLINRAIEIKDGVVNRFIELKDNAVNKVTEMYDSITSWFSDLWSSVSNTASNIKTAVTNRFTEFKDNAIGRVTDMYKSVTSWFGDMKTNVSTAASNIKTAVTNRFTEFKDNAVNRSKLMYEGVKGWFGDTYTNTKNRASNIRDGVSTRFTTMKENTVGAAKSMWTGVSGFFDDIWDDTKTLFNDMVDGAKKLPGRIGSAIKSMASKAVDGVASMGKSLGDRLGSVVNGVVNGLNKVLKAIGVSEIPTISINTGGGGSGGGGGSMRGGHATSRARFSTGTMNGAIAQDMIGIVNDRGPGNGFGGATQELIRRDGKLYAPKGRDVEVNLKRGDEIFNGAQTQSLIASGMIPRFSQGTGTEGGDSGEKKGLLGTLKDVVSNVWSYISDPKTAFGAIIDTVTPDFGGLSGFFGDMASGAFSFLKEKALSWLTGIFKENEGALGSGQKYAWMNYPITAGYSPNRPLAGYPSGFNGGRHYGVDFGTPVGTTVRAPMGGQLSSFWNEGGGRIAKLVTGQLRQFWMHMSSVSKSGSVSQGDIIGRTGNTGRWTTGPHVHYQAQQGSDALNRNTVNPLKVINGYSNGGIVSKHQIAEIAEDGPEAVIPLSGSKRGRANQLYDAVGDRIGRDDSKHYDRMINNQQTQIDQMTQAINVLLGIENKSGITENDIGKANDKYNARQTSKRGATTGRLNYV